jgi:hypothetical protein
MVASTDFLTVALLESWPGPALVVSFFALLGAVAGVAGGGLAFARAKERLRQRLVLGALAGALTSLVVFFSMEGPHDTITTHVSWCIVGGYAGADGILILLRAFGRGK